ncbi:MAG TPA: hypothetical protein VGV37_29530 [Aliidongia sp.]|uniref:hypothetical protein n=1 Tax=Aliidongia sp. TaxID=1914230 RepID=UPI002DDCFD4D|nr:hypothetical protein [Aliidongia sp.]HEV2678706.1 hypothetical protein [Aliidongia sp.]
MVSQALTVLLVLFSIHALLKFAFFFFLPYRVRRRALDRAYDGRASATKGSDGVLLCLCLVLVGLLFTAGADHVSFITGLLVGATLIQLYFHRFSLPLGAEETPAPPASPIKIMSYAIQARPARPWRELLLFAALILWGLYQFYSHMHAA